MAKPESSKPNKYKQQVDLLIKQIADLKVQQNEKEKIRGFSEGGASVESEVDDKESLAELESVKNKIAILEEQKSLNELFADALEGDGKDSPKLEGGEDDQKGGGKFICQDAAQARAVANQIVASYKNLGIDCDLSESMNGGSLTIVVTVHIPEQFKGKDPLKMSPEELAELKEGNKKGVVAVDGPAGASAESERPGTACKPTSPAFQVSPDPIAQSMGHGIGAAG